MNRFRKNIFLLFTLFITLFGIFYLGSAFADWTNDTEPPTTSIVISGTGCTTDPFDPTITTCPAASTATITLGCTDALSGCFKSYYRIGATGGYTEYSAASPPTTTIALGASQTVYAFSVDNAGNSELASAKTHTINFVYTVSGRLYFDNNNDGIMNTGDTNFASTPTMDINPPGSGTFITNSDGTYSINLPAGNNYAISNNTTGYTVTYPQGSYDVDLPCVDPPPSWTPSTSPLSTPPNQALNASCNGTNIQNLNFGVRPTVPWFQCIGADCRIDTEDPPPGGFKDDLPSDGSPPVSCNNDSDYPSNYASVKGPASGFSNDPGIIFSGSTTTNPNFGLGESSANEWVVGNITYPEPFNPIRPKVIRTSYDYYQTTIKQNGISTTDLSSVSGCSVLSNCTLPGGLANGVYTASSNVSLNSYTFTGNKNYVILVKGDLTIKGNILVDIGSTATFSASGDIKIDPLVGSASTVSCNVTNHNGCHVEGFYSTNKSFIIQGPSALRLNIAGAVVTNAGQNGGSVQNQRDIGAGNATCPTYTITERPDFVLNAPDFLKHANFIWQEVAP